jgi:hypothetical protein
VCTSAGVHPPVDLSPWPSGLEIVVRQGADRQYFFAINSGSAATEIACSGTDLLTGRAWAPEDQLGAGQVAVISRPVDD